MAESNSISAKRLLGQLLAILFAAASVTYSVLWVRSVRRPPPRPGFATYEYSVATHSMTIGDVIPGSPADNAGLRAGDRVVGINGKPLFTLRPYYDAVVIGESDVVAFTIEAASAGVSRRNITVGLHDPNAAPGRTRLERLLSLPISYYPLGFLVVGLAVLFLR